MVWKSVPLPVAVSVGAVLLASCGGGSGSCPMDAAADAPESGGSPDAGPDAVATTGAIFVDASIALVSRGGHVCPGISSFSISPSDLASGMAAQLGVVTIGPMPSIVQWTSSPPSGGAFSSATSASPTFTCSEPGTVTITVTIDLIVPDAGNVCAGVGYTTFSDTVHCEG